MQLHFLADDCLFLQLFKHLPIDGLLSSRHYGGLAAKVTETGIEEYGQVDRNVAGLANQLPGVP